MNRFWISALSLVGLSMTSCDVASPTTSSLESTQKSYFLKCVESFGDDVSVKKINGKSAVVAKTREGVEEKVLLGGTYGFATSQVKKHFTAQALASLRHCYQTWMKIPGEMSTEGRESLRKHLSSGRAVSSDGVMFESVVRGRGFGRGWQDPEGVIWGSVLKDGSGRIVQKDYLSARQHCSNIGGELPDFFDYMRLKIYFGFDKKKNPSIPHGYQAQLLDDFVKVDVNGSTRGLTFWATLDYKDVHPYYTFESKDGAFRGPIHPDNLGYVRCVIRTKPMPDLHAELEGRPIYDDPPRRQPINRLPWWYYDDTPFERGGRSRNPGLPGPGYPGF